MFASVSSFEAPFPGDLPLLAGDLSLFAGDFSLLAGDFSLFAGDFSRLAGLADVFSLDFCVLSNGTIFVMITGASGSSMPIGTTSGVVFFESDGGDDADGFFVSSTTEVGAAYCWES